VPLENGKHVLIVRIPKSIARPHAVTVGKHFRFYGRNTTEAYPLEVSDLRHAFLASEMLAEKMRGFRRDRLSQIAVGETPLPLVPRPKLVLHMLPVSAFELGTRYEMSKALRGKVQPISCSQGSDRFNFDGFLAYDGDIGGGQAGTYTQLFHNGTIEAVDTWVFADREKARSIPSESFEIQLVGAVGRYTALLVELGVDLPIWVCLSLLGVKGYGMWLGLGAYYPHVQPVERDDLIIPEIEMNDGERAVEQILKPAFDSIWNACGYERSENYDEQGNWRLKDKR
jgi:hypothetical protein